MQAASFCARSRRRPKWQLLRFNVAAGRAFKRLDGRISAGRMHVKNRKPDWLAAFCTTVVDADSQRHRGYPS